MGMGIVKKISQRVSNHGVADTVRWFRSKMDTRSREKRRGIDTGKIEIDETKLSGECCHYEPAEYETLDCIFQSVPIQAGDQLLDYGSGLGRVLIEGANYPFRKILGVEYDPALASRSRENIRNFQATGSRSNIEQEIAVVETDAREFEIPSSVTHIFLWNSFIGSVLEDVSKRIQKHVTKAPGSVHMIVSLPEGETDSLNPFKFLGQPQRIKTRFYTGADIYWFQSRIG